MKKTLIIIGIVATTVGCGVLQKKLLRNEKATMDVSYMDKSTLPQDDFFQFANGTWVKNNPVPPSESRWGSFNELNKYNLEKLTTLLEEYVSAESGNTSDEQLLADYYASFTDMQNRNNIGFIPIKEQLDQISKTLLKTAMERLNLSSRAYDRILKVARTIADLEGEANVQADHLSEAIHYRSLDRENWGG